MRTARLATICLVGFTIFSTGCIGCIDDETNNNGANGEPNNEQPNNLAPNNEATPTAECQPNDLQGEIDDADFREDVVLCGDVTINDNLRTLDDITVTIRPGTVIRMGVDKYIEIGFSGNEATLIAEGTATDPITFQGTTTDAGHWSSIFIKGSVTSDSVMKHVFIRHAGAGGEAGLTITNERSIEFSNITVENVAGPGVAAEGFGPDSVNLSVNNAGEEAVRLTSLLAANNFPLGGTFTGNDPDAVVIADGDYDRDVTFPNPGIPYIVRDNIRTLGTMVVTIEPGVVFRMAADRYIEFGFSGNEATINAVGTAAEPIRFIGDTAEAGHWDSIYVKGSVSRNSVFDHIEVEHSGVDDRAGITISSAIELSNATFRNNAVAGFSVTEEGLDPDSENINVENTDGASAIVAFNALFNLPTEGSYGSGDAYVELNSNDYTDSGTIPAIDVPYRVTRNVRNLAVADLTIEAGTVFHMGVDRSFEFGFSGNEITVNIDGVTFEGTQPEAGHWSRIVLRGPVTTNSSITNSTFRHGGSGGDETVYIDSNNVGITFEGNTIEMAQGVCIDRNRDTTDYSANNTLDCAGGDFAN